MNRLGRFKKSCQVIFLAMVFSMTLFACGGGGGGGDDNNTTSRDNDNQWDSMVWNQGEWG